jgi:hypothetical protein
MNMFEVIDKKGTIVFRADCEESVNEWFMNALVEKIGMNPDLQFEIDEMLICCHTQTFEDIDGEEFFTEEDIQFLKNKGITPCDDEGTHNAIMGLLDLSTIREV